MARAKVKISIDVVDAKAMAAAVDRCFDDLVANVPALREIDNHNATHQAREALKIALIKKTAQEA